MAEESIKSRILGWNGSAWIANFNNWSRSRLGTTLFLAFLYPLGVYLIWSKKSAKLPAKISWTILGMPLALLALALVISMVAAWIEGQYGILSMLLLLGLGYPLGLLFIWKRAGLSRLKKASLSILLAPTVVLLSVAVIIGVESREGGSFREIVATQREAREAEEEKNRAIESKQQEEAKAETERKRQEVEAIENKDKAAAEEAKAAENKRRQEARSAGEAAKARQAEIAAKTISGDEDLNLIEYSKDIIKTILKAPSTAKFRGGVLDYRDGWRIAYYNNRQYAELQSTVDSQNSFGAMLTSSFIVNICKHNNQYWPVRVVFDGRLVHQAECERT